MKPSIQFIIITSLFSYTLLFSQEQNWQQHIEHALNENSFNGLVIVAQDRNILFEKIHGCNGNIDINSEFLIGSISKQMTAVVILQLMEQNLLDIHTPIHEYLPEIKHEWAKKVTLKHLLNHTSGLQSLEEDLAFEPGSQFKYSAILPFYLASKIAEKVSGKEFTKLVQELFQHAGMHNSHILISEKYIENKAIYQNLITGFETCNDTLQPVKIFGENGNIYNEIWGPGTGIISCASDLLQWNIFIHTEQFLSEKSYDLLTTPSIMREHPRYGYVGYGLGLQIYQRDTLHEFSHRGYLSGYTCTALYLPIQKVCLIILENVSRDPVNLKQALYTHDKIRTIVQKAIIEHTKL